MPYQFAPSYFISAFRPILSCLHTTMLVTFCSFALAFVLAIVLAVISTVKHPAVQWIMKIYIAIMRGTPLMLQLLAWYFGPYFLFHMSIRGAIASVDKGQMEACYTCGMTALQGYRHVVLPQAFRLAIPSLMNNFIECFKGSAMCSMVGVMDMMLRAKNLANTSYRFIEVYLCVLLLYWVINMVFVAIQKAVEQKAGAKY